jgi:hypothetical protein
MTTASATRTIGLVLLMALALSQAGCLLAAAGATAGVGAYAYYRGNVTEQYAVEFGEAYQASKAALADMAMPVIREHHSGLAGTIESSLEDGTKVTVSIEEKPRYMAGDGHTSEVGVRVGVFGDQKLSAKMQQQIGTRLASRMRSGPGHTVGGERLPPLGAEPGPAQATPAGVQPAGAQAPPWKPAASPGAAVPPP